MVTLLVEAIMQREVVTVTPDTEVRELMRLLVKIRTGGVPMVTDEGAEA